MKLLSIQDIAAATGAVCPGPPARVTAVCTDTRSLVPGCLFVALEGENFDGHSYIPQALEQGAAFALSHKARENADPRVLRVQNTRLALLKVAGLYRGILGQGGLVVVGITGSVGKTTTKELAACVLQSAFSTLKTPANLNNEVGLSQTILSLEETHRAAVLELGVDRPGDMAPMARAAAADLAVVTGVGVTHLQQFETRENILAEKLRIREGMADGTPLLLCRDNDLLATVADPRLNVVFYSLEDPTASIYGSGLSQQGDGTAFVIRWQGGEYPAYIPAIGRHNVCDALAAFGAGVLLGIPPGQAAAALGGYTPTGMRQRVVERGGYTVVEDCYNASPESMQAALETLGQMPCKGRRIAILSDMLELGPTQEADHFKIGGIAAAHADLLLCTGPLAAEYQRGALHAGMANAFHYSSRELLLEALLERAAPGDILWLKASRGMHLELLLEKLYQKL